MIRLFYVSTAKPGFQHAMLDALVEKASKHNAERQITGALAFNGNIFAQVIEGNVDVVDQLMDNIKRDTRHSGIIIVSRKEIAERAFPDWGMKHIRALNFDELVDSMAA